jgi:hypothetical protein
MTQELRPQEAPLSRADNATSPEIALTDADREALRQAVLALEEPSYVARLAFLAGRPIELLGRALPQAASDLVSRATEAALSRALRYALRTIPKEGVDPETRIHKALAVLWVRWEAPWASRRFSWSCQYRQQSYAPLDCPDCVE